MLNLIKYWEDTPPVHVHLLHFFGNYSKKKKQISENEARDQMNQLQAEMGSMMGGAARPLPPELKEMILQAEKLKQAHKGL